MIGCLELYQIDYDELLTFLSHKCASSATMVNQELCSLKIPGGQNLVLIQGNHADLLLEEVLTKRYKIPKRYIVVDNKIKDSKKKKARH